MKSSQMIEKCNSSMFLSDDAYAKNDYRMTRQTGCTEYSKSQSIIFDQLVLGSSQILNHSEGFDKNQSRWRKQVIMIQSIFKGCIQRKKYISIKKWSKYRKYIYQELLTTEQQYLNDLKSVISNVIIPVEKFKLLPECEIQQTFSNICNIYNFNQKFYEEILDEFNKYHPNSCFGNVFQKFIPFFKIYFQYYTEYKDYQINNLRNTYPAFNEHLITLEQSNLFKGSDLNSFLIKPVQRLPKYALLIKDLVKNTWIDHPDYQNLQKTLQQFNLVTKKIDLLMGNILKNQALFDLQKKFFDVLNVNIVESTRNFILAETIYLTKQSQEEPVNLYLCSDLIVLSKKTEFNQQKLNERLLIYCYINEDSLLQDAGQCTLVLLANNQKIMFTCQDFEQKQKLSQEINNIINVKILEKSYNCVIDENIYHPIRVFVTSISRGQSKLPFKTYAKYDILVQNEKREYKIWTRHKILLKIQKTLQNNYKKEYDIQRESNILFQNWIENKLNKQKHDGRKIIIETFLETVLNSEFTKSSPDKYLEYLGLPQNFYKNDSTKFQSFAKEQAEQSNSSQDS